MAHLVQVFLPVRDRDGERFGTRMFDALRAEFTQQFGGVTAYMRAPAVGLWTDDRGGVQRDEMVILEVIVDALDLAWWDACRRRLEREFQQDEVLVRAQPCDRL